MRTPASCCSPCISGPRAPPRQTPQGREATGKPLPPSAFPGHHVLPSPMSKPCAPACEGVGGWPPSLFLLPLLWACQECREIRGRGHRKCLLPSKDSSSCKWRELGEGRACGKLSPRQGKPAHPSPADRRALSPRAGHCECPLRGHQGLLATVSCFHPGLSVSPLRLGLFKSRLSGAPPLTGSPWPLLQEATPQRPVCVGGAWPWGLNPSAQ